MSETEPDRGTAAVVEVERLVGHVIEELASFRRRALAAEGRVRDLEARQGPPPTVSADPGLAARIVELERENAALHARIAEAAARTERLLDRVRFARQQGEDAA